MRQLSGHVTIGSFADHNLAALVRSRLEDAGIHVVVPFEHTSALRIPFVSGRLDLFVREEDEDAALLVLNESDVDEDYDDSEIEDAESEGDDDDYVCPHCGSDALRLLPAPILPILLSIVAPRYSLENVPSRWHCQSCDQVWDG